MSERGCDRRVDRSESRIALSVVILTLNEVTNIVPCLRELRRVDDVIIVDSGSLDGTLDVARRERSDVRIFNHPFLDFGDQRNWAIDNTNPKHEWLLFIDADEYCDQALLDEIEELIANPREMVGGFVAGRNYFLGTWLRYSTMYPSYQLRVLKLGHVRFRKEGHGQREVTEGALCYLENGWRHEGFSKGVDQWVARHNRYATEEANRILFEGGIPLTWNGILKGRVQRRRVFRMLAARLPFRPLLRFIYSYFWCRGFLDGAAGFRYCTLLFSYHLIINAKLAEMRALRMDKSST